MVDFHDGKVIPPELANEIKPKPEDEFILDIFFDMYIPEQSPYLVMDAYCRMWELELSGEDITTLIMLWRTAESHRAKEQKEKMDKAKKDNKGSGGKSGRPGRSPRRR